MAAVPLSHDPVPDDLEITVWAHGPITVVALAGELDVATAPRLTTELRTIRGDVRVDCSELRFIDAAGLDAFVQAHHALQNNGRDLIIGGLSETCRRPFEIVRLDELLNLTG